MIFYVRQPPTGVQDPISLHFARLKELARCNAERAESNWKSLFEVVTGLKIAATG